MLTPQPSAKLERMVDSVLMLATGSLRQKTAMCERQVCRDHQDHADRIGFGVLIELVRGGCAYSGIEARYDIDELVFSGEIGQ